MKEKLKDYFSFTKSERRGVIILLILILMVLIVPQFIKPKKFDSSKEQILFKLEVEEFLSEIKADEQDRNLGVNHYNESPTIKRKINLFKFNPNTLEKSGWVEMGFSEKQAATIINYRNHGGQFLIKEDLKKLYVIDETLFAQLEPYIDLPIDLPESKVEFSNKFENTVNYNVVEINSADSLELLTLRGIGPVFAKRIIQYRDKIGGYKVAGQLMEVYGMDSIRYNSLLNQITVDTALICKIDLNAASLNDLKNHPYMDYYIAKAIIDKRIQKGQFISLDELLEVPIITNDLYLKIKPYLIIK